MILAKEKKWFIPMVEFDEEPAPAKKSKKEEQFIVQLPKVNNIFYLPQVIVSNDSTSNRINNKNWIKNFDPVNIEDLAVHNKKIQEVDDWLNSIHCDNCSSMLLLSGPVGCGKTTTLHTLCAKYHIKVTEWITPLDIEIPSHNGQYEFIEKQSKKFLDFIISSANFTSLLDNNNRKLVLVEDFPNTFNRTPSEFTDVLMQYKQRAKSPIVFICSESHTDNKNSTLNLFTTTLKEQFKIHHITFNGVSTTGLRAALKRVSDIINKKYTSMYNTPTADLIECVVNSSGGDVRSAVLNLHFAALKGSTQNLETSLIVDKEKKKTTTRKKKQSSSKFISIGKNETVSILHGVGRVLNPKVINNKDNINAFSHSPKDVIEQFISQPNSFVNFLEENFLAHFSSVDHVDKAASALSDADLMLAAWGEKICQEYGLYIAVAGLMTANKSPVSAWNPVRGPKSMRMQYPTTSEIPLLDQDSLYKGKTLVADYKTYCKIIASRSM